MFLYHVFRTNTRAIGSKSTLFFPYLNLKIFYIKFLEVIHTLVDFFIGSSPQLPQTSPLWHTVKSETTYFPNCDCTCNNKLSPWLIFVESNEKACLYPTGTKKYVTLFWTWILTFPCYGNVRRCKISFLVASQ